MKQLQILLSRKLPEAGYSPKQARYWWAIAQYETGKFQNSLFNYANNPWSMRRPKIRKTTAVGQTQRGAWAIYRNIPEAVEDLILYLQARQYPRDFPDFATFVAFMKAKGYFEEPFDFYYNGAKGYV